MSVTPGEAMTARCCCWAWRSWSAGWNFDQVGVSYGEIEPLITDGFVASDFDCVEKGAALPAALVGNEFQNAVCDGFSGWAKRACANNAEWLAGVKANQEIVAGQQRRKIGHGRVAGKDDR
jgi:hypothetical protein